MLEIQQKRIILLPLILTLLCYQPMLVKIQKMQTQQQFVSQQQYQLHNRLLLLQVCIKRIYTLLIKVEFALQIKKCQDTFQIKLIWTILFTMVFLVTILLSSEYVQYSQLLLNKNIDTNKPILELNPTTKSVDIYSNMFQLPLHKSAVFNDQDDLNCLHLQFSGKRDKYNNQFYRLKENARIYIKKQNENKSTQRSIQCVSTYTADEFNIFELDYIGGWVLVGVQIIIYTLIETFLWLKCTGCFSCKERKQYEEFKTELRNDIQ